MSEQATIQDCENWCVRPEQGEACSSNQTCGEGSHFCDYENGDYGVCQECKDNVEDCLKDESLSEFGKEECLLCDLKCVPLHFSETLLFDVQDNKTIPSNALLGSPLSNGTTGKLVDCSNLILENESVCNNANGSICLVEDFTRNTYYVDVVNKCAANGGIATIFYGGKFHCMAIVLFTTT